MTGSQSISLKRNREDNLEGEDKFTIYMMQAENELPLFEKPAAAGASEAGLILQRSIESIN